MTAEELEAIRQRHVTENGVSDMMNDGWFQAHGDRAALLVEVERLRAPSAEERGRLRQAIADALGRQTAASLQASSPCVLDHILDNLLAAQQKG